MVITIEHGISILIRAAAGAYAPYVFALIDVVRHRISIRVGWRAALHRTDHAGTFVAEVEHAILVKIGPASLRYEADPEQHLGTVRCRCIRITRVQSVTHV
jgi:hypothetical protein